MSEYQIKPNNYVEPEVRKEVVQRLLNYYVNASGGDNHFRVSGHCRTYGLVMEKQYNGTWEEVLYGSRGVPYNETKDKVVVTTQEMKTFAKEWVGAGYFISRGIEDKWHYVYYKFTKTPYTMYGCKVINDFIDNL